MNTPYSINAASIVRRNAWSAGLPAVLMIYFGFTVLGKPVVDDLFTLCNLVFYFTLRIGGVVMAGITLWCLTGKVTALFVDGMASIAIGIVLILTGIGMFYDGGGGMQSLLNVVFGGMFISSGTHNYRLHQGLVGNKPLPISHVVEGIGQASQALPPLRAPITPSSSDYSTTIPLAPESKDTESDQASDRGVSNPDPDPDPDYDSDPGPASGSDSDSFPSPIPNPIADSMVDPTSNPSIVDLPDETISSTLDGSSDSSGFLASFADDDPPSKP